MINKNIKLSEKIFTDEIEQKSVQNIQDEIFRKMPFEKKLSLLDVFFRLGKELQILNDRKR